MSERFDASLIGDFLFGVQRFFENKAPKGANTQITHLRTLKEYIYDSSIDMDKAPICHMYYVTTGKWKEDQNLLDRIRDGTDRLEKTQLFSSVKFTPVDADALRNLYKELKLKIVREINFERHAILPKARGINEAYLGILPCKEYLKLVCDAEGNLLRKLFYDNVRDFQGNNPVNREINDTINNKEMNDKFALFNNGITIVAQSISKVGTSFKIKDYQIVNGCQTSHILFQNRSSLPENSLLPVKLIVTEDADITNLVIKATNRQTEVKVEAFESLSPFQKKLEDFYAACGKDKSERLYYERRSKQYEHLKIPKTQIISLTAQIKSFLAIFLEEPHSTFRYYGELLDSYRDRIFREHHSPNPYLMSGYAMYALEKLFTEDKIKQFFRRFKYQILMLFRIQNEKFDLPYLNSKKIEDYCDSLLSILLDETKRLDAFRNTCEIIESVLTSGKFDSRQANKLRAFTTALIDKAVSERRGARKPATADVQRERGVVKWFSDIKGYGFIESEKGEDLFVHFSGIRGIGYRTLFESQQVEFVVVQGEKGFYAQDVSTLSS